MAGDGRSIANCGGTRSGAGRAPLLSGGNAGARCGRPSRGVRRTRTSTRGIPDIAVAAGAAKCRPAGGNGPAGVPLSPTDGMPAVRKPGSPRRPLRAVRRPNACRPPGRLARRIAGQPAFDECPMAGEVAFPARARAGRLTTRNGKYEGYPDPGLLPVGGLGAVL